MKRLVFLFVLCCFLFKFHLALSGTTQIYVKPLPNLLLVLDPQLMDDLYSFHVAAQIYDPLFQFDEFLNIKPHLAETYKIGEDGKTIILNLKPNIKFHNDKKLTVDDVIYTIQRFIKKSPYRYPELLLIKGANEFITGKTSSVGGLKKVSNLSLEISLTIQAPTIIMVLALPSLGILPSNLTSMDGNHFNENLIGTGPFKAGMFQKGKTLELIANKDYFKGPPKLDKIIYKYATRAEAIEGFNKGLFYDLQWYDPKPEEIRISYNVVKFAVPSVALLLFNTRKSPFNEKNARKAFSSAINKDRLMSECFPDKVLAKGFIPYGLGGYNPNFPSEKYNPSQFKKIRSAYLHNRQPINILWREYHPCAGRFGNVVKEDLQSAGFAPNIRYVTYNEFSETVNRATDFDVIEVVWYSDYPEALPILNYFKSGHKYNFSGFSSKEYDNLVRKALTTLDKQERYKIYDNAQKILENNNVAVPLYYDVESIFYQKLVKGLITPSIPVSSLSMYLISLEVN